MRCRNYTAAVFSLLSIFIVYRSYSALTKSAVALLSSPIDDGHFQTFTNTGKRSQGRNFTGAGEVQHYLLNRKKILQNSCSRLGMNKPMPMTGAGVKRLLKHVKLLFSAKYKILVCEIPKCGCSSVKKLLLVAEGLVNFTDPQDVPGYNLHALADKMLNLKNLRNISEILERMNSYKKLIIVRDPLKRLVSAYRNKMEVEYPWSEDFSKISRKIHAKFSMDDGKLASLEEFLLYLTQAKNLERHWDYFHHLCSPCTVEYDFIAHIETIADDMRYFMDTVGMNNITFPHNYQKSKETDEEKTRRYLNNVPDDIIQKIVEKYKRDYELFDFGVKL